MSHDACPKCGGRKRRKNNQCASCRGYGRGRHVMPSGYIRVWCPGHPVAKNDGYALEHRKVAYDAGLDIGGHHVHHINGDKADNRLENLEVFTESEHHRHHVREAGFIVNQYGTWPLRDTRKEVRHQ